MYIFRIHVSCFGSGPGSEVLGLNPFLPNNAMYHLFDECAFWEHNARNLLKDGLGINFEFIHCDIQKRLKPHHVDIIKKVLLLSWCALVALNLSCISHFCVVIELGQEVVSSFS